MRKLKWIKEKLKDWNKEVFGDNRERKRFFVEEINTLDTLELEEVCLKEKRSMNQKMKCKWAKEGDVNSKLFFKLVNSRKGRNVIKELEGSNGQVIRTRMGLGGDHFLL